MGKLSVQAVTVLLPNNLVKVVRGGVDCWRSRGSVEDGEEMRLALVGALGELQCSDSTKLPSADDL